MWPNVALLQQQQMGPHVTFSGIKERIFDSSALVYIGLHSSSDSSPLVYTSPVTRLH